MIFFQNKEMIEMYVPKYTYIPDDYSDRLVEIKNRAFQWRLDYSSRTENKTLGHITYYSLNGEQIQNSLILIPGLGSNSRTEPLMRVIMYWALMNKHDVYCLDTFWGDFLPETSQELAEKHTFLEYVDLIDTGLDRIEAECKSKKYAYSCLIGHSAGAMATFEIYNKRITEHKKLRFSASVMFAPFVDKGFTDYIWNYFLNHSVDKNKVRSKEDLAKTVVGITNPHELTVNGRIHYLSVLPQVYRDLDSLEFKPELMDRYNIPITLVAGGRDRKSPPDELRKKYNVLRQGKNADLWKLVVFKNSKHSFIDQYKDWGSILRLIQSQKRFAQKRGK